MAFAMSASTTVLSPVLLAEDSKKESASIVAVDFRRDVLPILEEHCVSCHGPETQEARIRLDNLSTDLIADRAAAETWHEVLNVLNANEMPPEDAEPLPAAARQTLTRWVGRAIAEAQEARRKTDGRPVLRRLNRVEYAYTMRDLLGLEMDYAVDLPPDPRSRDGFRNNGRSLQMSSLQLEYYLKTARRAMERVIVTGPAPRTYRATFAKSNVRGWRNNVERSNRLGRQQVFLGAMVKEYPETGAFRIRVTLTADIKPELDFPILEVSVGYRPDTKVLFRVVDTVEITSSEEQSFEFSGRMENFPLPVRGQGKFPGLVVRLRNVYEDGTPVPKKKGKKFVAEPHLPSLEIKSVDFAGPVYDQWPPALHRRILPVAEAAVDNGEYTRQVLKRFMQRAYRRPVDDEESETMAEFFERIRPNFPSYEEAMREMLSLLLIRPDFLYLMEPSGAEKRPLTEWELASRLSYFLWSTMPDDPLMERAAAGQLRQHLAAETERMLAAPAARRFVEQFTEQWLQLNVMDRVAVNPDQHPDFSDSLKLQLRRQPQALFAHLLHEDKSALDLLDADFVMVNGPVARHYGIPNVRGRTFHATPLAPLTAQHHRGGLLSQTSFLLANSTGANSHPVRRAVWIRDRLLDDPPAPPPPNVPSLEEADPKFHELSIREQLEIHREADACGSCHRNIDPWGIALEHYDAVGRWRDEIRVRKGKKFATSPVQARDTLPNGVVLDGVQALKDYLREEKRTQFARGLTHRLLGYAAGRRLELSDQPEAERIAQAFANSDYNLRALIHAVVASDIFQMK